MSPMSASHSHNPKKTPTRCQDHVLVFWFFVLFGRHDVSFVVRALRACFFSCRFCFWPRLHGFESTDR